ncbi:hypothetical protein AA984_24395 [Brevibacillus formosus]|nr:hypothetical protein AA984_24395 [Brevibacillus formosus]PSJ99364.1 hypothetical protein C7R91_03760 [Brevibacillus formosus]
MTGGQTTLSLGSSMFIGGSSGYIDYTIREKVHFFLRLYQPRYIKKALIQSVIATIINGDSYKLYANRLYEAYHSKQPYLDIAYVNRTGTARRN